MSEYCERLFEHYDHPQAFDRPHYPEPLVSSWDADQYDEWLQWLIDHPDKLRPVERNERILQIGNTKVRLVHGPIQAHLDWLQIRNASLVVRGSLREICLSQNIFLKKNAANLQPFLRWKKPIRDMKWSGNEATENLTQELLKLSEDQRDGRPSRMGLVPWKNWKPLSSITRGLLRNW